jgi:phage gp36-like protein
MWHLASITRLPKGGRMNERIQELVKQAIVDVKDEFGHWIGSDFDKEKFAKLIVLECADIATYHFRRTFEDGSKAIKEHFGVEE